MPEGNERFAELPGNAIVNNAARVGSTYRQPWTLPAKALGLRWADSGLDDKYRTFWLEELTPEMQHKAAGISKDNPSLLQQELLFRSIVQIGDKKVGADRDFKELWWKAIGPKCRMLASSAFGEMVSVDEADTKSFLAQNDPQEED